MENRLVRLTILLLAGLFSYQTQCQAIPAQTDPLPPTESPVEQTREAARHQVLFSELDLLRRHDFERAKAATISLRVTDGHGDRVLDLDAESFQLTVNGSVRQARQLAHGNGAKAMAPAYVLLVFPPNEPAIHHLAVQQCLRYFNAQPEENLAWRVGVFDSNGTFNPFTGKRSELLANLSALRTAKEPIQVDTYNLVDPSKTWQGTWRDKVNAAASEMARQPGPRLIVAMNRLSVPTYKANPLMLSAEGPIDLMPIADRIGAQIYIANVGGPDVAVPGGDAASMAPPSGTLLPGSIPSNAQSLALSRAAAYTSQMQQVASDTLGGFSNSVATLAGEMQRDLDSAYQLQFEMTPEDQDIGVPQIDVQMRPARLHAALLDIEPVMSGGASAEREVADKTAHDLLAAVSRPVTSPDFSIRQRVDYFPGRSGLEPILPMTCLIDWTGKSPRPTEIEIVESVVDKDLGTVVLERRLDSSWQTRGLSWERDGVLRPGRYTWRVAVADAQGHILASAQQEVGVAFPRDPAVAVSSLVLAKVCKAQAPVPGLLHRPTPHEKIEQELRLKSDPLQLSACRLKPEPSESYDALDTLHALVRIYPASREEKHAPGTWTATFLLRSAGGSIEAQQQVPFAEDAQSGLLAMADVALGSTGVRAGPHQFDVELRGPGLHKTVTESRSVFIYAAAVQSSAKE